MQKLNPKATWLFFFLFLGGTFMFNMFLLGFWIVAISDPNIRHSTAFGDILAVIPILIIIILLLCWLWAKLSYNNYAYELKDEGVRIERGVIWKKYVTIPYDRIQNVDIMRGLLARILGLSDLQIQTAGGITAGSYGAYAEGRLPGLSPDVAEKLRDEVLKVSRQSRKDTSQGGL